MLFGSIQCFVVSRVFQMSFYAVRIGKKPGIYRTWSECEAQVKGFPKASYKKFLTQDVAKCFLEEGSKKSVSQEAGLGPRKTADFKSKVKIDQKNQITSTLKDKSPRKAILISNDTVEHSLLQRDYFPTSPVVYTDGCCLSNGKAKPVGGVGVYWAPEHPRNVSEYLDVERPTNQIAELREAIRALEAAIEMNLPSIELRTDSIYTIKAMTEWIESWRENGWKTTGKKDVCNREEMMNLDRLCKKINVTWVHVPGHKNVYGNEQADRLANEGAAKR